ncbi:beta-ketoacyl synthase chain length factor [Micromonospora sp. KC606]|uniref:beta-ketoacyl synthase chain length factor n=1 Tax=Micromonospora sp. KC606 TaxID=2530379 RepID=UPI001404E471|nr:beta-ketoacyl synthase chain length factor [Micromonospora sp. KC606]
MTNEIHCSTATIAADFDLSQVANLTAPPEPPADLAALVRRYRSSRSAVVVQALRGWLQRANPDLPEPDRRGIVLGTATGAAPDIEEFLEESIRVGDHLVNPALFPMTVHNAAAGNAAIAARCRGPNVVVSAGIESVWSALVAARGLLRDNSADVVFVGGFESRRLANGTTGTVAALIAVSADPTTLGANHLAPLSMQLHRAGVLPRPSADAGSSEEFLPSDPGATSVVALVRFANAFASKPAGVTEPGGVDEAEAVVR